MEGATPRSIQALFPYSPPSPSIPLGTYTLTLKVWNDNAQTGAFDEKTRNVTVLEGSAQPIFTSPAGSDAVVEIGNPISITFTANDPSLTQQVKLVIDAKPSWLSCTGNDITYGNPISRTCSTSSPGNPPTANAIGDNTLTVTAWDNEAAPLSTTKSFVIRVPRFRDVSSSITPNPSTRSTAADSGDIDGDGDNDLVVAHPPSASIGTRIYVNDGSGTFNDGTAGRLPADGNYRSFAVRLFRQNPDAANGPGNYLDLFLTDIQKITTFHSSYPWVEEGSYRRNSIPSYRLKNNGSGNFLGHDWLPVDDYVIFAPWAADPYTDTSYASDIEFSRGSGTLNAYFANTVVGEALPDDSDPDPDPEQFAYFMVGERVWWRDVVRVCRDENAVPPIYDCGAAIDVLYDPNQTNPPGTPPDPFFGGPRTTDYELADLDGNGGNDIVSAGVAFNGNPYDYNYPTRIWIGSSPIRLTAYALANPPVGTFVEQKAALINLDGDTLSGVPRIDLVLTDTQNGVRLLRNTRTANGGALSFAAAVTLPGTTGDDAREIVVGDVNKDTKPDLILIGNGDRAERVFLNNSTPGTLNFSESIAAVPPSSPVDRSHGGILFDMDSDGDLDLFIYNEGQDKLYKNMTP